MIIFKNLKVGPKRPHAFSDRLLLGGRHLPSRVFDRRDWWRPLPVAQQLPGGPGLHLLRDGLVDHSHLRAVRIQDLLASLLRDTNVEHQTD